MTLLPVPVAPAEPHLSAGALAVFTASIDSAAAYAAEAKSPRTRAAYRAAAAAFADWCRTAGHPVGLPSKPASVAVTAAYLAAMADRGTKASTIDLHTAAIAFAHRAAGHEPPTSSEAVKAVVALETETEVDQDQLIAWCRKHLAHYKCPKSVDVIEALPRNPTGKILKKDLRQPFWEGRDRANV